MSSSLKEAKILPMHTINAGEWKSDCQNVLCTLKAKRWVQKSPLIIRSSALTEDKPNDSQAGRYVSIPHVSGDMDISAAITRVIDSYEDVSNDYNQVLVQPYLNSVCLSGVAFSRDPESGAPYYLIDYSEDNKRTDIVTSGHSNDFRKFVISHHADVSNYPNQYVRAVVPLLKEVGDKLDLSGIDIEFAFDRNRILYLFQARPLVCKKRKKHEHIDYKKTLNEISEEICLKSKPQKRLFGRRTIFGIMPDWNPAEIIGVRPKPLALSMYRHLIMNGVWAQARFRYGYKDCRKSPLLIDFKGLPYIDVRLSFNSLLPQGLDDKTSEKLLNYYLDRLEEYPEAHDKVESEIIFSCYTPETPKNIKENLRQEIGKAQQEQLLNSLKRQTQNIISGTNTWRFDIATVLSLEHKRKDILNSSAPVENRIFELLNKCKKYGTIPFSGLARSAFIAIEWLNCLTKENLISLNDKEIFLSSLNTVGQRLRHDEQCLDRQAFLKEYGHLRPGTYDIVSRRYDETPDMYFSRPADSIASNPDKKCFCLSREQKKQITQLLADNGFNLDANSLFHFISSSIFWREEAKFIFTKTLSDIFILLEDLGKKHSLTRNDLSYLDIQEFIDDDQKSPGNSLKKNIIQGRRKNLLTHVINLPPLITSTEDVWVFEWPNSEPNFVTRKTVTGRVVFASPENDLRNAIVMTPNADPGFDWIFARNIKGFISAYGGSNSHMAIRATEMDIPAVIGSGKKLYDRWSQANTLYLDCNNRQVKNVL